MYGNKNKHSTKSIVATPTNLRVIKKAAVGSLTAFQPSNVFHIILGLNAFNKPTINISMKTIVGMIMIPLGINS